MKINDLPDEVLLQVFNRLDLRTRSIFRRVCCRWKILMEACPPTDFKLVFRKCGKFGHLDTYPLFDVDKLGFDCREEVQVSKVEDGLYLLGLQRQAKSVAIEAEELSHFKESLEFLSRNWHKLERLELRVHEEGKIRTVDPDRIGVILSKIGTYAAGLTVTQLCVRARHVPTSANIVKVLQLFPHLESICIQSDIRVYCRGPLKLPSQLTSLLCSLSFDITQILGEKADHVHQVRVSTGNARDLEKICTTMNNLRSLHITVADRSLPRYVTWLAALTHLTSLWYRDLYRNTTRVFLDTLSKLACLKCLVVSDINYGEDLLLGLPEAVPNLESLVVHCANGTEFCMFLMTKQCFDVLLSLQRLKRLHIPLYSVGLEDAATFIWESKSIRDIAFRSSREAVVDEVLLSMALKAQKYPDELFYVHIPHIAVYNGNAIPQNLCIRCES